jgi:5'-3' exonuclease
MGIDGLWPYIKNTLKLGKKCSFKDFAGSKIAVDAEILLRQYVMAAHGTSQGTYNLFKSFGEELTTANVKGIFVFDGKNKPMKEFEKAKRKRTSEEQEEKWQKETTTIKKLKTEHGFDPERSINDQLHGGESDEQKKFAEEINKKEIACCKKYVQKLPITKELCEMAKKAIEDTGHTWIIAEGEGEATCCVLNRKEEVRAVFSIDSDCIPLGAKEIISKIGNQMTLFDVAKIREAMDLDEEGMIQLCMLLPSDWNQDFRVSGIGVKTGLKLIEEHGTAIKASISMAKKQYDMQLKKGYDIDSIDEYADELLTKNFTELRENYKKAMSA